MGNSFKTQADGHVQFNRSPTSPETSGNTVSNMKIFTLAELKKATANFNRKNVVGEGSLGRVFRGWLNENTNASERSGVGVAFAVKELHGGCSQEWPEFMAKFNHPNLVKLLGYCWEKGQFLLVHEYMQRGSLEHHLFNSLGVHLPWERRLDIAVGAAQGLSFLHSSEKSAIYHSFKASNILLDGAYNAKLSDFGLANPTKDSPFHTGYEAPEYMNSGRLSTGSDVYGFGVMMLEMLTGQRVVGINRPCGNQNLVEWAKHSLKPKRIKKTIDPKLKGQFSVEAAVLAGELIVKCLELDPRNRPSMEEVSDTLQMINQHSKHGGARSSQGTNN